MKIEKRTEKLRIVRAMNKVPGVLFGKSITPQSIQVDEKDLHEAMKAYGKTQTFTVKLGRESHQVYIKDIQRDIINKKHFLNVELLKVDKGDKISTKVPVHIIGKEEIEQRGHIVQIVDDAVEVEYGVGQGIARIDIDVSNMKVKDVMHIRDLKLPDGIKIVDDLDKVLIHIAESRVAEEIKEAEAAEAAEAETEVVTPETKPEAD